MDADKNAALNDEELARQLQDQYNDDDSDDADDDGFE